MTLRVRQIVIAGILLLTFAATIGLVTYASLDMAELNIIGQYVSYALITVVAIVTTIVYAFTAQLLLRKKES